MIRAHRVRALSGFSVLIFGAIVFIFPALWMISASLQDNSQILRFPPSLWPHPFTIEGYVDGFNVLPFGRYFVNTFVIAAGSSIGGVISSSLAGFAFAKLRAKGKDVLFLCVLSGLMIPYAVIMIPQYLLFKELNWINTYYPLIVPAWLGLPFLIFLFRQFFAGIPNEVFEAARIDGCGYLGLYGRIGVPLAMPAVATAFLFHFQASWNDFLAPLIYINDNAKYTLSLGLAAFTSTCDCTPWNQLMAVSATVSVIPVMVFFGAQKYILQGITLSTK
ncbi:sugar ABC transporter permease [Alicyclobacillus cellulosilyticus]|uniref:Sugar ABC transporter permease n=1 Tax=Alicyclobacillus cellulosilyticus TaxID=1003997 RepID=A0A917KIX8_9BACL|nr:carbohydrate ABC transporter permease [Alicyclobacillus cellulosilyticus]GGJ13522.1 sugar ABC transporter permease [Alicyclobacillus cellulosilyticus]